MSKFLDHPLRLAAAVVPVLLALHAALALSGLLPLRRPGGFDGLAGGLLTASGFLASMAGIVVVFLLSERGTVFRSVRVALGETIAPQMLSLFALPAAAMVLTLLAMAPVPGAIATLCLEASGALLILSICYEFLFLHLCVTASVTQDRQDESRAAFDRVVKLADHRRSEKPEAHQG